MEFKIERDPNYLEHHGILGQKWGTQNGPPYPLDRQTKKTMKQAQKDAKEYARAKMYYGNGAGTRRKLINNTVNQRLKDPVYKKAFEAALSSQDMEKHVRAAKRERKIANVKEAAQGVVTGDTGNSSRGVKIAVASIIGTAGILRVTGLDRKIIGAGKEFIDRQQAKKYMRDTGRFWK